MTPARFPLDSAQLELLLAFEATSGLSELSAALHRDPSVVSRALQKLAGDAPVLTKARGRWLLTPLGRQINQYTRKFLDDLRQLLPSPEGKLDPVRQAIQRRSACLLLVNAQRAFQDPFFGPCSNPESFSTIGRVLTRWRHVGLPVMHVRHLANDPTHPFFMDAVGAKFMDGLEPRPGEVVMNKYSASAFGGTGLGEELAKRQIDTVILAGFTASECIDATAKSANELGLGVVVLTDGVGTFDIQTKDGGTLPAQEVHAFTLAVLGNGIAELATASEVMACLEA